MVRYTVFAALLAAGVTVGSVVPRGPHQDFRAAIRLARDGDLQGDWNKMLDARERFAAMAGDEQLAALAHYYLGYTYWRLSSLAYVAIGPSGQAKLLGRAIDSLEMAIRRQPQFPDAHALLATCLGVQRYLDPRQADRLGPRIREAWKAALPDGARNPRVMLLRAMSMTFAPPPDGDREKGLEFWRQAIEAFPSDRPAPLMPDWGDVEAVAWLGGTYLALGRSGEAAELLERAVRMRGDFWWARRAALPIARRPVPEADAR